MEKNYKSPCTKVPISFRK